MGHTILLVDDDQQYTNFIKSSLIKRNFSVVHLKSGRQALDAIRKYHPDLIILEIKVPEINGFDLCKIIRKKEKYNRTPIIFLSNINSNRAMMTGFELGADDYLTKPINKEELIARILVLLRRSKEVDYHTNHKENLSFQETRILQLMEKGYSNKEIAQKLSLTEGTIKVYNHVIYQKLQVKNRTQAIVRAMKEGII